MLRFKADRRSLMFVASYYGLVAFQWFAAPKSMPLAIALVVLTCCMSWFCAVITHNTLHSPVFKSRWMNKLFQIALTCSYGFPVSEYVPGHNLSHHKYTQQRRDVMRTSKVNARYNWLNLALFVPRVAKDVTAANMIFMREMKATHKSWFQQFLLEASVCCGEKIILFFIDWRKTLIYIVIPHLWAVWGITAVNYLQHDGCDPEHPANHSRNFTGEIFNWFTFNNGFHGVHHEQPGLHWSLLPVKHAELLHPIIDPRLEQKSLAVYLFHAFVWPGKRLKFDGTPVVLPEEGPDHDWVPRGGKGSPGDMGAEGLTAAS